MSNLDDISKRIDEKLRKLTDETRKDDGGGDDKKKKKKKKRKRDKEDESGSKKKRKKFRWKQIKDKSTGKFYFWDTVNDKTSWKEPKEPYESWKDKDTSRKEKDSKTRDKSRDKSMDRKPGDEVTLEITKNPSKKKGPLKKGPLKMGQVKIVDRFVPKYATSDLAKHSQTLSLKTLYSLQDALKNKEQKIILTNFSGIRSQLNSLVKEFPDDKDVLMCQAQLGCRLQDWEAGALSSDYLIMTLGGMGRSIRELGKRKRLEAKVKAEADAVKKAAAKKKEAEKEKEISQRQKQKEKEEAAKKMEVDEVVLEDSGPCEAPPDSIKMVVTPGQPPFKLLRRLYFSHYYENAKTAATEWENEADVSAGWVDHSCLVLFVKSAKTKTVQDIRKLLSKMEQCKPDQENILSVRSLGRDYLICEFISEESAYTALTNIFKCQLKSPVEAYERAMEWFPGAGNLFVQFCNKEHLENAEKEGEAESEEAAKKQTDTTAKQSDQQGGASDSAADEPTPKTNGGHSPSNSAGASATNATTTPTTPTVSKSNKKRHSPYGKWHTAPKPPPGEIAAASPVPLTSAELLNGLRDLSSEEVPAKNSKSKKSDDFPAPKPKTKKTPAKLSSPPVDRDRGRRNNPYDAAVEPYSPKLSRAQRKEQNLIAKSLPSVASPGGAGQAKAATKKKKKRKAPKFNKKMSLLVNKWAKVSAEIKEQEENDVQPDVDNRAAVARNRQEKADQWRREHRGETASDNPNLIQVGDWRAKLKAETANA